MTVGHSPLAASPAKWMVTPPPQVSVAFTNEMSGAGAVCGAHRDNGPGHWVIVGLVVSTVQVLVTRQGSETLPQASRAVMVKIRVCRQPVSASLASQLRVGVPAQSSLATTKVLTLTQVGSVAGLQPRSPLAGQVVIVGLLVSTVQV